MIALWEEVFADHFWHMVEFLTITAKNRIMKNPTKFCLASVSLNSLGSMRVP